MEQVLIFANPIAGRGRGRAIASQLQKHLVSHGYDVTLFTQQAESAQWQGLPDTIKAAIVIGGDGTLRGVAQWAIQNAKAACAAPGARSRAEAVDRLCPYPLLVVPMGTANLMGKHLGIKWNERTLGEEVVEALEESKLVNLDVATTRDGVFLLMAGVGFDASVVHELGRIRSGPIDITNYVLPAVKAVAEYRFSKLTVTVDGKQVFDDGPAMAFVGNIPEYGTGFPILPLAKADDQLLDVCVMPCSTRRRLLELALAVASGDHLRQEDVVYLKGTSVRIESPDAVPVQVDGEPAGTTPLHIDLLPGRIPFIVPPNQ